MLMKSIIIALLIALSTYSYSQLSIEYSTAFSLPFSLKKAGSKTYYNSIERNYYDWNAYGFDNRLMIKKEFQI